MSIKIICLTNNQKLISQIEEVSTELGEPDCKLIDPYLVGEKDTLSQWLIDFSSQREIMLSSDKILTLVDPKDTLLKKYERLIK
tara:strand:+ start:24 stop:275 length:252 start_codon:yes stop_codon:yes gene_type:complete